MAWFMEQFVIRNSPFRRVNLKRKINGFMIFYITLTTQFEFENEGKVILE